MTNKGKYILKQRKELVVLWVVEQVLIMGGTLGFTPSTEQQRLNEIKNSKTHPPKN